MSDLTTAQRLAAYRDELKAAGFNEEQVAQFVAAVARPMMDDLVVQADLDSDDAPSIGEVRVHLMPLVDNDDLTRVVERVRKDVAAAAQ